jgi:hypothetical protein
MTQSTILAAGVTQATSTDVVVAAGAHVTVGIFGTVSTYLPSDVAFNLMIDTPDGDNVADHLSGGKTQVHLVGPGTFRVVRPAYTGSAFGVFLEA